MQKALARNMTAVEKLQSKPPIIMPFTGYARPLLTCMKGAHTWLSGSPFEASYYSHLTHLAEHYERENGFTCRTHSLVAGKTAQNTRLGQQREHGQAAAYPGTGVAASLDQVPSAINM